MPGDASDTSDLLTELQTKLEAAVPGTNKHWTLTLTSTGQVRYQCDVSFTLKFALAGTTLPDAVVGSSGANQAGVLTGGVYVATSPRQSQYLWNPEEVILRDTRPKPRYGTALGGTSGGLTWVQTHGAEVLLRDIEWDVVAIRKVFIDDEVLYGEAFERFWRLVIAAGGKLRVWDDVDADFSAVVWSIREPAWLSEFPMVEVQDLIAHFQLKLPLRRRPT